MKANTKIGFDTVCSRREEILWVVASSVDAVNNMQNPMNQNNGLAKQAFNISSYVTPLDTLSVGGNSWPLNWII